MKKNNKWQSALFLLGGLLMVVGAGCYSFMVLANIMCWVFLVGTCLFATMQMAQTYEGDSLVIRRLKRIQCMAGIFFMLSGILMVDSAYHVLLPLFNSNTSTGYYTYIEYVYNKWVVLLLIAAVLEMYTTHRLDAELKKIKNT